MPIKVPELDDRSYAALVAEGVAMIPAYSREWTNHNAADPGITYLELFAYLTDVLLFRLNRISEANRLKFLKMMTGESTGPLDPDTLETALRQAHIGLRQCTRAVTCDDYETIAREATADGAKLRVARAKCFQRRNFARQLGHERYRDRPGHTSVIVIPYSPWADEQEIHALAQQVREYFEPRRLLTSRVHISGPQYVDVAVGIRCAAAPGASATAIRTAIAQQSIQWFHPLTGGPKETGWPFGRNVFASDIYRILKGIPGIRVIERVDLDVAERHRLELDEFGEVTEVLLGPDELVKIRISDVVFSGAGKASTAGVRT